MEVTATEHYSTWIPSPMDVATFLLLLKQKTLLLLIFKILASRRLSQLDTNAERLQFFNTLPLFRAVAVVAVAFITNNIRLH